MNAIVTVVGKDRVGIIAAVCVKLAEYNVNVLDLSQTVLENNFTMVMPVHTASSKAFIDRGGRIPAPLHSLKN